jgi:L-aspartate oxidase
LSALSALVRDGEMVEPRRRAQFEDVALTLSAAAVTAAALARTESRGCHHRADNPDTEATQNRSTVVRCLSGDMVVDSVGALAC